MKEDAVQDFGDKSSHPKDLGLLQPGQMLKSRWQIVRKIGQGGFGEIYMGVDVLTNEKVAVKVESARQHHQLLKRECSILRMLIGKQHVCRFIGCELNYDINYVVMELLGNNLSNLRNAQPGGRLSLSTNLRLGLQILKAIHSIHEVGYLHRDIKPANFCVGRRDQNYHKIFMIDFGLAKRYESQTGEVLEPRAAQFFIGTRRYASINALKNKELGRRDDLWSLLYILAEFANGKLPWKPLMDINEIREIKEKFDHRLLLENLPSEFHQFLDHVESLQCRDRPDYEMLAGLFEFCMERLGVKVSDPFDWDKGRKTAVPSSTPPENPRLAQPAIPGATHISDSLDSSQEYLELDSNHKSEVQPVHEHLFDHLLQETASAPVTKTTSECTLVMGNNCNATLDATQAPKQPRDTKTELSQGSPRK